MDSTKPEIAYDFSPTIIIYKDGKVERLEGNEIALPCLDPKTSVASRDVVYSPENGLSVRLYVPKDINQNQKLPLVVYFHGGGFYIQSPFSLQYHGYLNSLVAEVNIIAVSVQYRRAPEYPVPCAYDDSWTALQWVASHVNGEGPDGWLNCYADFKRVFFSGDSAGANIAHQMGIRHGQEKLQGINVIGIALFHPYFWGKEPVVNETTDARIRERREKYWRVACPNTSGCDDPWINPVVDPNLASMGCTRLLVLVAEKDLLAPRGFYYYEKLKESGWGGEVEITETKGEGHVFHLKKPHSENAVAMLKRTALFFNKK